MSLENNNKQNYLAFVLKRIRERKSLLVKVFVLTFLVSCLLIIPVPRYYICNISLAPEIGSAGPESKVSSIASSFGFNLGSSLSSDAISPALYPELIATNDFILKLIDIPVQTKNGQLRTTYYNYLDKHQSSTIYLYPLYWIQSLVINLFTDSSSDSLSKPTATVNPFHLSKRQTEIFGKIKGSITCNIDMKTDLISISVEDQDPLIAATIADSVRAKLQDYIILYRTNKARVDLEYYQKLMTESKQRYEKARQLYAGYADANNDVVLMSFQSKKEDLENDMQLKYNTYSTLNNQYQAALAKVQERTPAFTVVQRASVPIRPAGPKRMAFVVAMLCLSMLLTITYINRDLLLPKE